MTTQAMLAFCAVVAVYAILSAAVYRLRQYLDRRRIRREFDNEMAAYNAAQERGRNG